MRRIVLITINSLFLLCAGLWVGATVGIGAIAAPAAFRNLEGLERGGVPLAGHVVGNALQRLNTVSLVLVGVMVAASIFELFYRRRLNTKKLLMVRILVILAAFLVTLYLARVMMPAMLMEMNPENMDVFRDFHARYRMWAMVQVILGAVVIVLTNAINIGPRRDGGHPRPK